MIDQITRDVIRSLRFPTEDITSFHPPTALRIARNLNTSFFIVKRSLDELTRLGFRIYVFPNYNYIGVKKAFVRFQADYNTINAIANHMSVSPPPWLDEFTILGRDHLGTNTGMFGILYQEQSLLDQRINDLLSRYDNITIMNPIDYFKVDVNLDRNDAEIVNALSASDSVERRVLGELVMNPFITIKQISKKIFLKYNSNTYRKIKRILDSLTRSRAYMFETFIPSGNIMGSTIFVVQAMRDTIKGNSLKEKIGELKELIGERYLSFKDYYSNSISFICYYNNRNELIELKERMINRGYSQITYFEGFAPVMLQPRLS